MKVLGLRNSLGKAFSDVVAGTTFTEGNYNCTVMLFNETIPSDLNNLRPFDAGYASEFNYHLVKDCVGMFNAIFSYDSIKDKFVLGNTSAASENQSSGIRKADQYATTGISCLAIPTLNLTTMITPIVTTLTTNTLWYAPTIIKRGVSGAVPTDVENTDSFNATTQYESFMHPRFGSSRALKQLATITIGISGIGAQTASQRLILKYKEPKIVNKLLLRVASHIRVTACQMRIHAKTENNSYTLVADFRFNPTANMIGNYVEIDLPEFTADTIHIAGLWLGGGVTQGNPGVVNLSEIAFGRSNQSDPILPLTANFGIVAFGTRDYAVRMNNPTGRFPQKHIPMFLLETGANANQLDVNLNNYSSYLRLNRNVEI